MKGRGAILLMLLGILFTSCDPDVAGEGIDLPAMEFDFRVSPDTAYLKVGDTFTMHAAISSLLSNGVILTDGEGEIWFGMSKSENIPRTSEEDFSIPLNNIDYKIIIDVGGVKWIDNNQIFRLTYFPKEDSIIMSYKFVFLKKGLYQIGGFQSSFYEGTKGKTRANAHFDVINPHWNEFWQVTGSPAPTPNDYYYYNHYLIAVTE